MTLPAKTTSAPPPELPQLTRALAPVLAWIKDVALPFWGTVGFDSARGGFHERLDLAGRPITDVPRRLMVQGRQLYVCHQAATLGWYPEAWQLADRCVSFMVDSYYRADGEAGWVFSLSPDGTVANATRDLYAHAFALLGLASYHRVSGDNGVLELADATLDYLDQAAAAPAGGYLDAVPPADATRRQNPHMHLFEALIALYAASSRAPYLARATELFDLFASRFFDPQTGSLCEYLDADLKPLPNAAGRVREPGHHYEWIWLLRRFQHLSGRNVDPWCAALYDHADRHGWDAQGFIIDEVDAAGAPLKRSRRSWPHTEGLKANIVEGEAGRAGCEERAVRCLTQLWNTYLARPVPGGWIDHVDVHGAALVKFMPASTLYHVVCTLAEAERATSVS
jgi:mannose/cellobiose epimerase-like protein (N-acyl-D-glucosamine 2-epimerase family)